MEHLERRGRSGRSLAILTRAFRPIVVIPTYDNPQTIERVVEEVRGHVDAVVVVDDGGGAEAQAALARVRARGVTVVHRNKNGGKGAAVKDGLRWALNAGFTHALQIDADGQHALEDAGKMLEVARAHRNALVLAEPVYDETAPRARRVLRHISIFWVDVATIADRGKIADPMCGFRVYPLAETVRCMETTGDRMDFDPEIAVRLVWQGLEVVNVPTHVRYLSEEEGGVSHFRAFRDNVLVSIMHARLCILRLLGLYRLL